MRTLVQDLRYGARMLLKGPVVSMVAALSLALGIAGATAMFALASGFFLQPLPFPDQDSMILVEQLQHGRSLEETSGVSMPNFRDMRESATTLRSLAAYTIPEMNLTGGDQPERIRLVSGTPNTLEVLGTAPWMGRGFEAADGPAGAGRVLILTHGFWESRFLSDPGILGKAVQLDGVPYTIVG
ncbi:MAG: ABC transporter permease, partial [Gemmatimonadota bacterium]